MTVQKINDTRRGFLGSASNLCLDPLLRSRLVIGLLFTGLVCQRTASMPSRIVITAVEEDNGFVFPGTEDPWQSAKDEDRTTKREASRQENDVESGGDIVFPNDEPEHRPTTLFTPGPAPECRTKTYCERTDFYPVNYVRNVIKKNDDLQFFAGVDVVEDVIQRISDDTTALCPSEERLVYPTAAQNREKNWLFVVNQENFQQGVRVETCLNVDGECSVISGFVGGYKSMCKQKYILRQLAAISPNGTAIRDMFKLPSSCCCHIKYDTPYNRMGISLDSRSDKQTPIPNARR